MGRSETSSAAILLGQANLRATRQRLALLELLLKAGGRPFTADAIYEESQNTGRSLPRSTISAALRRLMEAGLVVKLAVGNSRKTWFSVNGGFASVSASRPSAQIE